MSQTFQLRDRKAQTDPDKPPVFRQRVFHGAHSWGKIDIKGNWSNQGHQPVGVEGGVPHEVAAVFDKYPHVHQIAIVFKSEDGRENGSVFTRIDHEVREG